MVRSHPRTEHVPVLLERCLELLAPAIEAAHTAGRRAVVVDATIGPGGHSHALLSQYDDVHLIGIDRDTDALAQARECLAEWEAHVDLVHAVYDEIPQVVQDLGFEYVDGVLMDLGVSSLQIDRAARGFSYRYDAPLDMRMDQRSPRTAADIVNHYSRDELARLIRRWGQERWAGPIASRIVAERVNSPITGTGELARLIHSAVPAHYRGGHPAKRTFQALRIEVNRELETLELAIPSALKTLAISGRCVVMSYHSLEDAIVKEAFSAAAISLSPPGFPVELDEHRPEVISLTRGVVTPSDGEIAANPRAASARLRAVEKIHRRRKV